MKDNVTDKHTLYIMYNTKFHYDIQVADLVSDLAIDKLVPFCDQLATFLDRKQVADWFGLSGHVEIARISLRPAFDPKSRELVADPYEVVGNRVCDQVCEWNLAHIALCVTLSGMGLITDGISRLTDS